MWWHRRGNSGGSWLPENKKAKMGTEGEKVVAHGLLTSPALETELWLTNELYSSLQNFNVCVLACIISHGPNLGIV